MSPIDSTIPGPNRETHPCWIPITVLYVPVGYGSQEGHPTETLMGQTGENKGLNQINSVYKF